MLSWEKTMLCCLVVILGGAAGELQAQGFMPNSGPGGPPSRPSFSPYLNITRQGGSPALNYYGLVRPQNQADMSIQQLQLASGGSGGVPMAQLNPMSGEAPTGNAFGFQTYRTYFQNQFNFSGFGNAGGMNTGGALGAGGLNPYLSGNRAFQNLSQPPGPQLGPPRGAGR